MKPANFSYKTWLSLTTTLTLAGCISLQPPPIPKIPVPPPAPQTRVVHTVVTSEESSCGSLHDFVIDVQKLASKNRKELLDELSKSEIVKFSCDRLKTGLLLSQIGKTVKEDSLAIEILQQYQDTDKLNQENKQLVQLLLFQSKERKRLHILLGKLGQKLTAQKAQLATQKALSTTMSDDLLTLQQKMNQLQKLETDINETEQSIATPSLDTETKENSGS